MSSVKLIAPEARTYAAGAPKSVKCKVIEAGRLTLPELMFYTGSINKKERAAGVTSTHGPRSEPIRPAQKIHRSQFMTNPQKGSASPHTKPIHPTTQTHADALGAIDAAVEALDSLHAEIRAGDPSAKVGRGLLHIAGVLVAISGDYVPAVESGAVATVGRAIRRSTERLERAA